MAAKFNSSSFSRTSNLPTPGSFTICGFAKYNANTGTYGMLADLDDGSHWLQMGVGSSGNTLQLFSDVTGESSTIATLSVGDIFFWAVSSASGANATVAYFKPISSNSFTSVTGTAAVFTPTSLYVGSDPFNEPFNGSIWNVKCWDRALTSSELLIESYYSLVQFPTNLNFHWPMRSGSDIYDLGGNARNATVNGTVTTEDIGVKLWNQSPKLFVPTSTSSPNISAGLISQSAISAALSTSIRANSTLASSSSLVSGLSTAVRLQSNISGVANTTLSLTTSIKLAETIISQSSLTAGLVVGSSLSSSLVSQATLTSSLTSSINLGQNLAGVSSLTPVLQSSIRLATSLSSNSTTSASLNSSVILGVNLQSNSSISASLGGSASFQSSLVSNGTLTSNLSTNIQLGSPFSASATVSFDLLLPKTLATSFVSTSGQSGSLSSSIRLNAGLAANTSTTSSLSTLVKLQTSLTSSATTTTTALSTSIKLGSALNVSSSFTSALYSPSSLQLNLNCIGTNSYQLNTGIPLSSSFISSQNQTASLLNSIRLGSNLSTSQSSTASLSTSIKLGSDFLTSSSISFTLPSASLLELNLYALSSFSLTSAIGFTISYTYEVEDTQRVYLAEIEDWKFEVDKSKQTILVLKDD